MAFSPHDAATHGLDRARTLLEASRPTVSTQLSSSARGDIRRLSIVMAVAALDTYLHRLIVDRAYTHRKLPGALAKLDVTFRELLTQADAAGVAARSQPHNSRPRVAVKRQLRDRLLHETFQRYEDVARALGMAGHSKKWDAIGQNMKPPTAPTAIRTRLNNIVMRRNQIVHEGDYKRLERPRNAGRNGITSKEARADIEFIAQLVEAIHAVISAAIPVPPVGGRPQGGGAAGAVS